MICPYDDQDRLTDSESECDVNVSFGKAKTAERDRQWAYPAEDIRDDINRKLWTAVWDRVVT